MLNKFGLTPLVFYGTVTSEWSKVVNGHEGKCLVFQVVDPTFRFPMTWEVYSALFSDMGSDMFWGFNGNDIARAKLQSEEVYQLFLRLAYVQGLARLWVTPSMLFVQGYPEHYEKVAERICAAMTEVFGEFEFHKVEDGQLEISHDLLQLLDYKPAA